MKNWISACGSTGSSCVEVASHDGGMIAVRDSKHPEQDPLIFDKAEMADFFQGVKEGKFDHLLTD